MEPGLVLRAVRTGRQEGFPGSGDHRADALLLESVEAARAAAMEPASRERFIAGRAALRRFVAELLDLLPDELESSYSCARCGAGPGLSHGRPGYARNGEQLPVLLSLARTQDWILLAGLTSPAKGMRLGVDAEDPNRMGFDGFDAVALGKDERLAVASLSGPALLTERARLWVRKEAWLKMTGEGLRTDPRTIEVANLPGVADLDFTDTGLPPAFAAAAALG
ncbi:4'-phosphopantetheinyl transferase superfamily protein [Arthrobacter sp. ISL-48]|uniref:4'-phosphopantetheinyl transferase family protein n=1 Tax=Arthrobacter sp. ISL-48 TaxID=2819110 RepID=UPI001BE93CA5|nr:4'-phosphopantetheinyl transferase superfamily protein [Arthrobacter sp. ISL-48]MBT2530544.1 4'-phosphopantetheinyl transferase superfamily protein [Arthrobacter sp. ISL-48]